MLQLIATVSRQISSSRQKDQEPFFSSASKARTPQDDSETWASSKGSYLGLYCEMPAMRFHMLSVWAKHSQLHDAFNPSCNLFGGVFF